MERMIRTNTAAEYQRSWAPDGPISNLTTANIKAEATGNNPK